MKISRKTSKNIILPSLILLLSLGFAPVVETQTIPNNSKLQIGLLKPGKINQEIFITRPNDNYYKIARRYGVSSKYLMNLNNAKTPWLKVKEPVTISRSIEPSSSITGLIINLPEKKLYHFSNGRLLKTYGVAVGKPSTETPMGNYNILYKTKAPSWYVPVSIQKEMAAKGQTVRTVVPPGPGNPLGNWWMAIGSGIGIHSTNAPASIGYSVSHGCIRMKPKSAEDLFKKVKVKTPVKIIYQPIKIGVDNNNNVYLEAYPNMYGRNISYTSATNLLLKQSNLENNINWDTVSRVLTAKQGVPVLISKAVNGVIPEVRPAVKASPIVPSASPTATMPNAIASDKPIDIKVKPKPTATPTPVPTEFPTVIPSVVPTVVPTPIPTILIPTPRPTPVPTRVPVIIRPAPTNTPVSTAEPADDFIDTTHPR